MAAEDDQEVAGVGDLTDAQSDTGGASFDRNDAETARRIIEKLLPNPDERRLILEFFIALLMFANEKPDAWGVILHPAQVGLSVGGGFLAIRINIGRMYLASIEKDAPTTTNPKETFLRFPYSHWREKAIAEWLPLLSDFFPVAEAFIRVTNAASQTPLMRPSRQAHSPGVLRYLEEEMDITLPIPMYPETSHSIRYWRIGTREGDIDRWPAMHGGGFVSIGWSILGDLRGFITGQTPQEGRRALHAALLPHVRSSRSAADYAWQWNQFAAEIGNGDIVVAMNG